MKYFIVLLAGIALGLGIQMSLAHSPCNDFIPRPEICGFQSVVDNFGNIQQVYICKRY